MAEFEVKVRNLKTGETLVASMADAEQCIAWLEERPPFIEILTVLSDVSPAESKRMKEAMRPYDSVERELKAKYDAELEAALQQRYQEEMALIEKGELGADDADADPNRPLAVKYEIDEGFTVVDDSRPLTDAARAACVVRWTPPARGPIGRGAGGHRAPTSHMAHAACGRAASIIAPRQ